MSGHVDNPAVSTAEVTCSVSPYQVEGSLVDGRRFYFRARFRAVALGVGATDDDAVIACLRATDEAYGSTSRFSRPPGSSAAVWLADAKDGEFAVNGLDQERLDRLFDELLTEATS